MQLRELWNKIRRKEKEVLPSTSVARIEDVFSMPKKENFRDDFSLSEIKRYRKEYLEVLKRDGTITSADFMPEELYDYRDIYLDLLLQLCLEEETDVSFEKINDVGSVTSQYLDSMIVSTKLNLYLEMVGKLRYSVSLRVIALNELINHLFLSKNKKKAILNEIENLLFLLVTLTDQEATMKLRKIAYLDQVEKLDYHDYDPQELITLTDSRLLELKEMMGLVMPVELARLETLHLDKKLFIAVLEQKLEIYVYTHQELLESFLKEAEQLFYEIDSKTSFYFDDEKVGFQNNINVIKKKKAFYFEKIHRLELLFKMFHSFGRKLVSKDDLEKFYRAKFKILTIDLFEQEDFDILKDVTFTELEYYQEIVFEKIEQLSRGYDNDILRKLAYYNSAKAMDIIDTIMSVLKNDKTEFSMWDILNDKRLLGLILAFDTDSGLDDYFKNVKCSWKEYPTLNYFDEYFTWEEELPLDTIFRIMKCNLEIKAIDDERPLEPLYIIYQLFANSKKQDPYFYYLPEGLLETHVPVGVEDKEVIRYICNLANEKHVMCPSSLIKMSGNLFYRANIKGITLNDDVTELSNYALLVSSLQHIIIPCGLSSVSSNSIPYFQCLDIGFRGKYDDNFKKLLFDMIMSCYHLEKDCDIRYDEDSVFCSLQYVPSFLLLVFYDEKGDVLVGFQKEELTFQTEIHIPVSDLDDIEKYCVLWSDDGLFLRDQILKKFYSYFDEELGTDSPKR